MKRLQRIITFLFLGLLLVACDNKQRARINYALSLVEACPDSTLQILNAIDQTQLPDREMGLYALAYTMAQDKSGLDVDNDSLLHHAYNWYSTCTSDSLYAQYLYYMGKYYALNDSTDKALDFFKQSAQTAKNSNDTLTQCLAMAQLSEKLRYYDPYAAVLYADSLVNLYNKVRTKSVSNQAYDLSIYAKALFFAEEKAERCIGIMVDALSYAKKSDNDVTIADVMQDISVFYSFTDMKDSSLWYAKQSFDIRKEKNTRAYLSLSMTYIQNDSLSVAKNIIARIPKSEYARNAYAIFSQLRSISLKENDLSTAAAYMDSTESYLQKKIMDSRKSRDAYYLLLTQKETARVEALSKHKQTKIILSASVLILLLVLLFVLYVYRQKEEKRLRQQRILELEIEKKEGHQKLLEAELKQKDEHQRMIENEIKHKEVQIATMRSFLNRKVDMSSNIQHIREKEANNPKLTAKDWKELEEFLESVDDGFVTKLRGNYSELLERDIHLLMLIRLKMSNADLAKVYSIEEKSIKQRLFVVKEKLNIANESLSTRKFIENM